MDLLTTVFKVMTKFCDNYLSQNRKWKLPLMTSFMFY